MFFALNISEQQCETSFLTFFFMEFKGKSGPCVESWVHQALQFYFHIIKSSKETQTDYHSELDRII